MKVGRGGGKSVTSQIGKNFLVYLVLIRETTFLLHCPSPRGHRDPKQPSWAVEQRRAVRTNKM